MVQPALGATRDGRSEFFLDRPMGYFILVLFGIGAALTVGGIGLQWQRSHVPSLLEYLLAHASTDVRYVFDVAAEVWLAIGLVRGRRWGLVGLGLLGLSWLGTAIHYTNLLGLFVTSVLLVYSGMRLGGSLGPVPRDEAADRKPYRGDAVAYFIALLSCGVGFTLVVMKIADGWHHAQDMGTIAPIPFVLSRWWIHARYIVELAMEFWTLGAIRRNQRWGFFLLAWLSAAWLVPELIHSD